MSPLVYAHRGVHDNITVFENTRTSFALAIKDNLAIECDIRLTKDKKVVVFHDKTLKRLLNENIEIKDITYQELQQFHLGEDTIPFLEDVLKFVDGQVDLLVEVKNAPNKRELCQLSVDILGKYQGNYKIQSFSPLILVWFRLKKPQIKRGLLLKPIKRYPYFLFGLLVNSMVLHPFIKPDFYAYEKSLGQNKLSRFFYELFAKEYAIWTLNKNEKGCLKNNQYAIKKIKP